MPHIASPRAAQPLRILRRTLVLLAFAGATALVAQPPQAHAGGLSEARQLVAEGHLPQALAKVDALIAANPQDPQYAFLRGVILSAQHKTEEAIQVFTRLTQQYPELPEPYNNLAVLYASQSKYEAAKNALEMAIRTHPSYATAHENLGDLYAKMASLAYDKALALDNKNAAAQTKLALIQDMIGGQPRKSAAVRPPAAAPKPAAVAAVAPRPAVVAAKPVAEPATANAGIEAAVARWAQAWSARDVDAYLAAYAGNYAPAGMTRSSWEAQRRDRISAPKEIDVQISDLKIEQQGDTASASFRQTYRSDRLTSTVTKTLQFALQGGAWRIVGETSR